MEADGRIGVLHVISGLGLGGAEKMLLWSARYHDRDLVRMGVVSLMSGGELAGEIRREKVEVYELEQERGRLSVSGFKKLQGVIRSFGPRILQGHMFHSNILVRVAGGLRRQTAVLSTRHIDIEPPGRRIINGATGFLGDGTLVFSRKVLDEEIKENLFRRPVRLIQYGIEIPDRAEIEWDHGDPSRGDARSELRKELNIPADAFVWTAVGRLTEQKGFAFLVNAFSKVSDTGDDPYLIIIGDGEERGMLQDRARKAGVDRRVIFGGSRIDAAAFMEASDAFVLSSLWEGGPLVILEAMAAGIPVVSTRVGDAPSMICEGQTGLLVDPGEEGQLAEAMARVQGMGTGSREWGFSGRRRVEEFYDFRRAQREMEIYYQELTGTMKPVQ